MPATLPAIESDSPRPTPHARHGRHRRGRSPSPGYETAPERPDWSAETVATGPSVLPSTVTALTGIFVLPLPCSNDTMGCPFMTMVEVSKKGVVSHPSVHLLFKLRSGVGIVYA